MPIAIELRDNSGTVIGAAGETPPGRMLPEITGDDFPLLRGVDEYDDTVFNSLQMTWLLEELKRLRESAGSPDRARLLEEIIELGNQCATNQHTYLVFVGD